LDGGVLFVAGAFLVLVGFITMARTRMSGVRRRLNATSTIRARARIGGSAMTTYQGGGATTVQVIAIAVMLAGGVAVIASMMVG